MRGVSVPSCGRRQLHIESPYWEMLKAVLIMFVDQFLPTGAISSSRSTTQLLKLPILLYPICLSSQNTCKAVVSKENSCMDKAPAEVFSLYPRFASREQEFCTLPG